VPQPASFKSGLLNSRRKVAIPAEWWRLYHDKQLDDLIAMAHASNQNLSQAIARLDQARALARISASYLLPTVTATPSYTRNFTSANAVSPLTGLPVTKSVSYNDWQVPFDLSYEIDVWGRVRRSAEASAAQAVASADDLEVVQLTVETDVASYYYTLRSLDAQVQILQQNVSEYAEQVRLVSIQLKSGLVPPTDLFEAKAQLESTEAQLRDLQRARADEEHALAILCGQAAPTFSVRPHPLENGSAPSIPPGLPGDLLTLRPDVAEAEQNVVSFNAQVGVATAEFFPTFTLTSMAGFESASFEHILDWKSKVASIAPSISIPIFEGGRLRFNLAAVKAQYRQAVGAYVNQVLVAYGDVEDALTDLHAFSDEVGHLRAAVEASEGYVKIARIQYAQGLITYLVVIDAERTLLSNQLTLSQDINLQTTASIHLIKALGGGWNQAPPNRRHEE
jgi:multidrug efflux system outer membrane protein